MEPKEVYKAISQVAAYISKDGISKGRKNQQQGYAFRGVDDIYNALAPALVEAGLIIIPRILSRTAREVETKNGGKMNYVTVDAEYDFVCVIDGSMHTARVVGEAMDSADKATNKAMSAAYKYLCLQTFCIPTEGDNDADATTHEIAPAKRQEPKPPVKAAPLQPTQPVTETIKTDIEACEDRKQLVKLYNANKAVIDGHPEILELFQKRSGQLNGKPVNA